MWRQPSRHRSTYGAFTEKQMNVEKIIEIFNSAGINLEKEKAGQFLLYSDLLKEYNEKFNLTAIIEDTEIVKKHFIDSVIGLQFLPSKGEIIDIGSGAGFPAIPIKIMQPNLNFTLIDSVNKKVNFLNIVIEKLGLLGTSASHIRIEDEARGSKRESYDCVLARAVSFLPTLAEYALPLLKVGGIFVAYKGENVEEEVALSEKAIKILGGELQQIEKYTLLNEYERSLVIIKKIKKTPIIYPRTTNKPRTSPL